MHTGGHLLSEITSMHVQCAVGFSVGLLMVVMDP